MADEVLGAIQSAMGRADFQLDRFRLIDWVAGGRRPIRTASTRANGHERQPGALIFRKIRPTPTGNEKQLRLQVVLLVLETPTAGVHRAALKNAMNFVERWNRAVDRATGKEETAELKPRRSGVLGFDAVARARTRQLEESPGIVSLITGSAMADVNETIVQRFAPGVSYQASGAADVGGHACTRHRTRVYESADGAKARAWRFSSRAIPRTATARSPSGESRHGAGTRFQPQFTVSAFPLHVAELRSDAPSTSSATRSHCCPTPIVPLSLREATPPADQLPALRPELTTPVVEATLDSILDNIRHEDVSAVGIVATDSRDVLFLAREVKKHAPDVQLFFAGSYLLYLHPEYIPYTRGAIVAAPYPLA